MYAYFKKLDYFSTECVYAPFAARGFARDFIKDLEVGGRVCGMTRAGGNSVRDGLAHAHPACRPCPGTRPTASRETQCCLRARRTQVARPSAILDLIHSAEQFAEALAPAAAAAAAPPTPASQGSNAGTQPQDRGTQQQPSAGPPVPLLVLEPPPAAAVAAAADGAQAPTPQQGPPTLNGSSTGEPLQPALLAGGVGIAAPGGGSGGFSWPFGSLPVSGSAGPGGAGGAEGGGGNKGARGAQQPKQCQRCGYLTSQPVCKACVLLEGLNK